MAPLTKKMRGFKFAEFDALCAELSDEELQLKWQHYTRTLTSASTSTTVSVLAAGPTGGVSMIGAMIAGPLLHNARKKRQMVGRHMRSRGLEPDTRAKDVYVPLAIGGTVGAATMGVGSIGAEALAVDLIADKTVAKVILHTALDVGVTAGEEKHLRHEHKKEQRQLGTSLLRPSRSFVEETRADTEYTLPGSLRPSRSFVVEGSQSPFQPMERTQQQQDALLFRPSRSRMEDTHLDFEYTMAGALRSSASVISKHDQDYHNGQLPTKQSDQADKSTLSTRLFEEKYPLIYEYITSSNVSGQLGSARVGIDVSMLSGVFESFDDATLDELERDLEQAVEDMDAAYADQPEVPVENAGGNGPHRTTRTFEEPSHLDNLVRRHSVLYTSNATRRSVGPSILMHEAPPAYGAHDFADIPELGDRKAWYAHQYKDAGSIFRSSSTSTLDSVSSDSTMPPRYDHLRHPSTASSMSTTSSSYHRPSLSSASSMSTIPTSYDRTTPCRSLSEYSTSTAKSHSSASSWTSGVDSGICPGSGKDKHDPPTSPKPVSEYPQSEYSVAGSLSRFSVASRTSTVVSRASSVASSTHQGLAKTKYLGLETATKLAVGGSLCLVGVRPSVQRKMLDKAKGKFSEAKVTRHADDDYKDYV